MALSGSKLAQELVRKSLALHKKLSRIEKDRLNPFFFAYRPEKLLLSILPGKEPPIRLTVLPMPQEEEKLDAMVSSPKESFPALPIICFCMVPPENLNEDWLRFLKRGGFHPSPKSPAPFFFLNKKDGLQGLRERTHLRFCLLLVTSVLKAIKAGLFTRTDSKEDPVLLVVTGDVPDPKVLLVPFSEFPKETKPQEIVEEEATPWRNQKGLPSDLLEWKEIDHRVTEKIASTVRRKDLRDPELLSLFFGSREDAARAWDGKDQSPINSFVEWLTVDYRPAPDEKTRVESLLEWDLPPRERSLLEARAAAAPSLYTIEWIEEGKYVVLGDLFTGRTFTVWDVGLSKTAEEGVVVAARIYRAGDYYFLTLFGPPLKGSAVDHALEILEKLGMDFTPKDMKEKSHLFGRLFVPIREFYDRLEAGPLLRNFDGDPFVLHTAAFHAADLEALRKAMDEREDMDPDPEAPDDWTWTGNPPPGSPVPGDRINLGRIRVVGDELLLEVNSENRYKRGRKILEAIPGVTFESLTKKPFSKESLKDLPLDDKLLPKEKEEPPSGEMRRFMEEEIRKFYMKWLDTPIPALGGKTPRQACSTEKGRRKVAVLIRTIPPSSGPEGISIPAPKKEMLKELGLDEQTMEQG